MAFARSKNRRRADAERTTQEIKVAAARVGPLVAKVLLSIVVTGGIAAGAWYGRAWALTSPAFALKRVELSGNQRATEAELIRVASLSAGQNLFGLDVDAAERAMRSHPWVQKASVRRRLPSTVEVTVVEHVPVALTALGELYLVDEAGEPFKRVQPSDQLDLPLVTGVSREEYVAQPEATAARFVRAILAARTYAASAVAKLQPLSEVRLSGEDLGLVLGDGTEVRLGTLDPAEAFGRLSRVQMELSRRGLVARVVRLDNRARPGWVAVSTAPADEQLSTLGSERRGSMQ